jgi:hypothetical protein
MKNIISLTAIIFFLAGQICFPQTDHLNIRWDQNPPQDSVLFYRLYRAYVVGENSDTNFSFHPDSHDYSLRFDNINDTSIIDQETSVTLPGNFIKYTVTAVNANGESERANPKGKGIPKIRWVESYSILYNDSIYVISYDSAAFDLDNDAVDLKFELDNASLQNVIVSIDSLTHNLLVSADSVNYTGIASFILEVHDLDGFWDRDTVSLEFIENINVYLNSDEGATDEDNSIEINLIENDSIPNDYSYSLVVDGSNLHYGQVEILNDSVVSYIPLTSTNSLLPDEIVHDYFRYRLRIDGILTVFSNVDITVIGLNDQPIINVIPNDTVFVNFNYNYQVFAIDPDSGDVLTFLPLSPNLNFLSINQNTGLITGSPTSPTDTGTYNITVQVRDLAGAIDSKNFQLTVQSIELTLNNFPKMFGFPEDATFQININEIEVSSYGYQYPMIHWEFTPSENLYVDTSNLPIVNIYADLDSYGNFNLGVKITDPNLVYDTTNVRVEIYPRVDIIGIQSLEQNSNEYKFRILSDMICTLLTEYWSNPQNIYTQSHIVNSISHTVTIPVANLNGDSLYVNFIVTDSSGFSKTYSEKYELTSIAIESVGEPFAYPNPYRPSSKGHDRVIFENIPADAEKIMIFDVAGNEVFTHDFRNHPTRRWEWQVKNHDGDNLASGLYIYVILGNGDKKIKSGKIAVIR